MAVVVAIGVVGCTDGTPAFCTSLRDNAELGQLADALDAGKLDVASAEARRLQDLAGDAPPEIRADLEALGDAVVQIVDLLADEQSGSGDAGELERRRERLNAELAELDQRSERVSDWALQECGLRLDSR
jgi:hypothetical protein